MFIEKIYKEADRKRQKLYPQHVNRASSIGFPCRRYLCYSILRWEDREVVDQRLQLIFNEGHTQERAVLMALARNGVDVVRQQEEVSFPQERLYGHIDGVVHYRTDRLLEIKSISDHMFDKFNCIGDFLHSDFPFHVAYPFQVAVYLKGLRLNHGLFILKNKNSGQLKEIPFTWKELKYVAEAALWTCKVVNDVVDFVRDILHDTYQISEIADFSKREDREDIRAIKEEACQIIEDDLPGRITNLKICECCPFQHICLPDEIRDEFLRIYTGSKGFIEMLARRELLSSVHSEYDALDRKVKTYLKRRKEEHFFIADGDRIAFEVINGKQMKIIKVEDATA